MFLLDEYCYQKPIFKLYNFPFPLRVLGTLTRKKNDSLGMGRGPETPGPVEESSAPGRDGAGFESRGPGAKNLTTTHPNEYWSTHQKVWTRIWTKITFGRKSLFVGCLSI